MVRNIVKIYRSKFNSGFNSGQILAEILIGLTVATTIIAAAVALIAVVLRSNVESKNHQTALALAQEQADGVKIVAEADWNGIYNLGKGTDNPYYLTTSGSKLATVAGSTSTDIGGVVFTKFFNIENVNRKKCGTGEIIDSAITSCSGWPGGDADIAADPSTQKLTSRVQWPNAGKTSEASLVIYLTRWHNSISRQTNWSGGSNQTGPINEFNNRFSDSTNIDYSYATSGSITIQGF